MRQSLSFSRLVRSKSIAFKIIYTQAKMFLDIWLCSLQPKCLGISLLLCVHFRVSHVCVLNVFQVCQKLTEYGVHFHRVLPEKRSQTGIMLGVYCKGVLIFEVLNGNRTPVLRFPWRETKKISFTVCTSISVITNMNVARRLLTSPSGTRLCRNC